MSTIRYCGQCGYANEINARFCGQCGHTLPALSPIPTTPIPRGPVATTFQLVLPYMLGAFGLLMVIAGILLYTDGCIAGLDLFRRCPVAGQSPNAPGILANNEDGTESIASGNRNLAILLPTATRLPTRTPTTTPPPTVTPLPSPTSTATPSPTASLTPTPTSTSTNTPAPSSTPTLRNDIIIEDFEGSFNVIDINRSPGNNTLNLSIVNNPRASGNKSLQMSYQINGATPDQDDYIGFRASLSGISNWQNFSMFCIWIQNDGYSGHLVVQIHPQQGGRWKAAIPLTGFSSGTRCVNFATDFIERGGPLVDIQNYEIYLGDGGATSGTIYIDYMRIIP